MVILMKTFHVMKTQMMLKVNLKDLETFHNKKLITLLLNNIHYTNQNSKIYKLMSAKYMHGFLARHGKVGEKGIAAKKSGGLCAHLGASAENLIFLHKHRCHRRCGSGGSGGG